MKPETIDWEAYPQGNINVKMEDVEIGDIVYEQGHQIVVLSTPTYEKNDMGEQWSFSGLCNQRVQCFLTTVDSAYKLRLTWEPTYTPVVRVDGSERYLAHE